MVSLQNIEQAQKTYNQNPTTGNYQIYQQLVDKYNQSVSEQEAIQKARRDQAEARYIKSIPTEVKEAGAFAVNEYTAIGRKFSNNEITEKEAKQQLQQLYQKYPETKQYLEQQQTEFQKRFESYDIYGKLAFFIKNPEQIENLPDQHSKDQILSAIAEGKALIEDLLGNRGLAEQLRGTGELQAKQFIENVSLYFEKGLGLDRSNNEYIKIQSYLELYNKAKEKGDTKKMAEYKEYMINIAVKSKLEQQDALYILKEPSVQFALSYAGAKLLTRLPIGIQKVIGWGSIGSEIPSFVSAVEKGKGIEYLKSAAPTLLGGGMGVTDASFKSHTTVYTPKQVKGPSISQKAYSIVETKFPGIKTFKTKFTSYKPVESYLGYKSKIRAGYTPSRDIPISERNVYRINKGGTDIYYRPEIYKGRGTKGWMSPEELARYKPGTKVEPFQSYEFKVTRRPAGGTDVEVGGFKLFEKTKISTPRKDIFGRYKISKDYGYIKQEATFSKYEPPTVSLKSQSPKRIVSTEPVTPRGKAAFEALLKQLKSTEISEKGASKPLTESQYQSNLRTILSDYAGKPKKFKLKLPSKRPFISDITGQQQLSPQTELITKQTFRTTTGRKTITGDIATLKVPISTVAPLSSTAATSAFIYKQKQIQIPESITTRKPLTIQSPIMKQYQYQTPIQIQKIAQLQDTKMIQKLRYKQIQKVITPPKTKQYKITPTTEIPITPLPILPEKEKKEKRKVVKVKIPKKIKYREREFKIKQFKLYKPKKVKL